MPLSPRNESLVLPPWREAAAKGREPQAAGGTLAGAAREAAAGAEAAAHPAHIQVHRVSSPAGNLSVSFCFIVLSTLGYRCPQTLQPLTALQPLTRCLRLWCYRAWALTASSLFWNPQPAVGLSCNHFWFQRLPGVSCQNDSIGGVYLSRLLVGMNDNRIQRATTTNIFQASRWQLLPQQCSKGLILPHFISFIQRK